MAEVVLNTKFQFRRGNAIEWETINPVLAAGEPGFAIDVNKHKIGNGVLSWNDLPWVEDSSVLNFSTRYDFPSVGNPNIIYKAESESCLYQWNSEKTIYEKLVTSGLEDIDEIYGGDSYGTT